MRGRAVRNTAWFALVALLTLSGAVGGNAAGTVDPAFAALRAKADPRLTAMIDAGRADPVVTIVTGAPHVGVTEHDFPDRAQAMRELDRRSARFFAEVGGIVTAGGGDVRHRWSAAPALSVDATLPVLNLVASLPSVRGVAYDDDESVHLIEPLPGSGVEPMNTQGRQMIQAEEIWSLGFRGEGIKVAIIDTGIDPSHEAFKGADGSSRVASWRDWVNNQPNPYDDHGHGTHVGGTSVGSSLYNDPVNGLFQETGVAPNATLYVEKFLDSGGGGSFENANNSLQHAFDIGADITSNSWGSGCGSFANATMALMRQLTDLGMLSVFAAGNSGPGAGSIGAPACSESALSVGAIDGGRAIAFFSSRGPCTDIEQGTPSRICPDVVAKGVAVRSSIPRSGATWADASGYRVWEGTSMATPHVAGAAALAEQMKRFYTGTGWDTPARDEEVVFKATAEDLGSAGEDNTFGSGLPQLLSVYSLLNSPDEAIIVHSFSVSLNPVRQGQTSNLIFSVRNLGSRAATGTFTATLTDPNGNLTVLRNVGRTLGLLEAEVLNHPFTVGNDTPHGTYTFHGTFPYSWTDANGDVQTGTVDRTTTFEVRRVFVAMDVQGLAATAPPVVPEALSVTATNTGNEAGTDVLVELRVPEMYQFVPGSNFTPADTRTRYANPRPDTVYQQSGQTVLVYYRSTFAVGATISFTLTLIPTVPATYEFQMVARYRDGAGQNLTQSRSFTQIVGV